ncbi:MAG: pyridoxamine 5'-phosphate oxidase [Candidatus Methylacidiphilales bacterium]|nr:pyridoxamine 5'-phosphate oxidase [Candidatus Methylacidiphilales bacterium]
MSEDVSLEVAGLRRDYTNRGLRREDLAAEPFSQFRLWFQEAQKAELLEPNAMTCATADRSGRVTARTVLLKAFDERGFVFFTNTGSTKARQLAENPQAALLFAWLPLERQVSVSGKVEKITPAETLAYFASRPFGSRLGAWVSMQSSIIPSRKVLEMKFEEMKAKFAQGEVPLPDFWSGYRVAPQTVEFWQGGRDRLHDRFLYSLGPEGYWSIDRLSP